MMQLLRFFASIALVFASLAVSTGGSHRHPIEMQLDERDEECENSFNLCSPTGAASIDTPSVGTGLSSMYQDLVDSIQGVQNHKRAVELDRQIVDHRLQPRASKIGLCCRVAPLTYHTYSNTQIYILGL